MVKSSDCTESNHGSCKGFFEEMINGTPVTRICMCQCHDSTYQLVRNTIGAMTQAERSDPYGMKQSNFDDPP